MEKKKIFLVAALLVISMNGLAENSVEIDLNNDTLVSTEGLDVNYGDLKLHVFELRRDREKEMLYMDREFTAKIYNPAGRGYLHSQGGEFDTAGKNGKLRDVYGYLEVGAFTGAEYPNDKIYYGGKEVNYLNGNISLDNAWLTTDPAVRKNENPEDAGYFLLSKSLLIEPEKQITFRDIDLRRGSRSYLPFTFPWFRQNIRPGSKVPLFPSIGSSTDYGWNTSWGALYGDKDSRYVGGFAPKYSEKLGVLVGRWENWYTFENIGQTKLNIDDLLVVKKNSGIDDRYSVNLAHDYEGEKGNLSLDTKNSTANMVSSLDDIIKSYDGSGAWERLGVDPVKFDDFMGFYTLETSLKELGENKDITFEGKVKQVSSRETYDLMVFDYIDDGSNADYDLYTDLSLYKDNGRYKIGGYYNELRDMNPGDNTEDDSSKKENYGFVVQDKENKIDIEYDLTRGDKYRELSFIEKNSNLKPWIFNLNDTLVGRYGDYTLQTIPEYSKYDKETLSLKAGEYKFIGSSTILGGFDYSFKENELALGFDPFRSSIKNNLRDEQFNRYENIIYEKSTENRGYAEIATKDYTFTLGGGTSKEEIWDRDGYYNYENFVMGEAYDKYTLESDFIDFMAERKNIKLGESNDLRIFAGIRYDDYRSGELNGVDYESDKNSSVRLNGGLDLLSTLYSKEDRKVDNEFSYAYQGYTEKDIRLAHKENFHKVSDKISFDLKKLNGEYTVDYSYIERASNQKKEIEIFSNGATFNFAEKQSVKLYYGSNERFTDKNNSSENRRDLSIENYGLGYGYDRHKFNYDNETLKADVWNIDRGDYTDNSNEKIRTDRFNYGYDFRDGDKLSLSYVRGTDKRYNEILKSEELSIKKDLYEVSYFDLGTRYDNSYSVGYGKNRYGGSAEVESYSTDNYNLSYSFMDKTLDPEFIEEYAMREYDKERSQITPQDLERVASLIRNRGESSKGRAVDSFNLIAPWKRAVAFSGDYTRRFGFDISMEKNEERYRRTDDFMDSLENFTATLSYSQRRIGMAYTYKREVENPNNWDSSKNREHWLSLNMKIGKPSEGYRLTTYMKFEDEWFQNSDKMIGNIGMELGKEFGYYEWSVGFLREYNYGNRDYEWRAALQFTLLTFPDRPIFGAGANRGTGSGNGLSPEIYLFDGVKASDVELD